VWELNYTLSSASLRKVNFFDFTKIPKKTCKVSKNNKMECLLGIRFNDYVLLAADAIDARSIVVNSHSKKKT
jgi:hypothetical protein